MFDFLRDLRKSDKEKEQETLTAYLDSALTPTQMIQFEQRLSVDADLRRKLEQQRQIKENLRLLPKVPAPRHFTLDPAVYGRPQFQPGFNLYPALRTATVLVAVLLVFAVSFDLFTGTVSAPDSATFESAVGELAEEDQTLEQALPAEELVASEPLEESAIVASEAIEAPAEIEAEVIEETEADASTEIGTDETPLEERSTNFFQPQSTEISPAVEEEAGESLPEELLAEEGLALESVLASPQPPKAAPEPGGAVTTQPQATATKSTKTGIGAADSEEASGPMVAQPTDNTESESVLTQEVEVQPTISIQATVQAQAMLPSADVDQADGGLVEIVASPIRLFEAALILILILLVIATLASRRWR
jgi:anti-sigma factor RsiW